MAKKRDAYDELMDAVAAVVDGAADVTRCSTTDCVCVPVAQFSWSRDEVWLLCVGCLAETASLWGSVWVSKAIAEALDGVPVPLDVKRMSIYGANSFVDDVEEL